MSVIYKSPRQIYDWRKHLTQEERLAIERYEERLMALHDETLSLKAKRYEIQNRATQRAKARS